MATFCQRSSLEWLRLAYPSRASNRFTGSPTPVAQHGLYPQSPWVPPADALIILTLLWTAYSAAFLYTQAVHYSRWLDFDSLDLDGLQGIPLDILGRLARHRPARPSLRAELLAVSIFGALIPVLLTMLKLAQ